MSGNGRVLMVQGTASSAGKSLLVTGLCRLFRQEGYRVAPFKAQNMSNNSFVTLHGEEMGRAQVEQAYAAGAEPDVRMNPVLLKPEADHRSQAVVMGRPAFHLSGAGFQDRRAVLWPVVTAALDGLRRDYDMVVIEGAGSPAEINLRAGDIVNMQLALHAAAPVLLVGDIDRGGVFAHLYGTLALLSPHERALVRGLVINKFRGDRSLLANGLSMIAALTGIPVLAVVPWLHAPGIAEEDAVAIERQSAPGASGEIDIAVPRFPRISNFDDLDPLLTEPDAGVRYVDTGQELGSPDLIILPGTKSTVADLAWLRATGLADAVARAAAAGTPVLGICGGFQMLGEVVRDPQHAESVVAHALGLALLPVSTDFSDEKATRRVTGTVRATRGLFTECAGLPITGYEIHMGTTTVAPAAALLEIDRSGGQAQVLDGTLDASGWIAGTYLHGLLHNDGLRRQMLHNLAARRGYRYQPGPAVDRETAYDRLAAVLRAEFDVPALLRLAGLPVTGRG